MRKCQCSNHRTTPATPPRHRDLGCSGVFCWSFYHGLTPQQHPTSYYEIRLDIPRPWITQSVMDHKRKSGVKMAFNGDTRPCTWTVLPLASSAVSVIFSMKTATSCLYTYILSPDRKQSLPQMHKSAYHCGLARYLNPGVRVCVSWGCFVYIK